ncbi:MAG TPA: ATP-binding cassette domain-containing protein [Candidatus Paceibacterota bacterium]|jgi:multiple sugar transport system ATP-binding protein|nr:ATP-binding cassette domain-containing protein [Candidatus Paceibacterota bacterium]
MINKKVTKKEANEILKENNNRLVDETLTDFVSLQNINKIYPNGFQAVYDFNLGIKPREFVALVGPSGCGKSTTLRMVAGLEEITSGALFIDKVYSNYLPSKDRDIAMVFQSYALYPQLNVYDNIAFGLKMRRLPKEEIKERVFAAVKILKLGELLDRKPKQLSGGQMQRVALGRALVRNARVFLMDEPLSNLDAKLRVQMRAEIMRIHREAKATTIYVTHDQTEAMTMANRIVIMNKGFIQQVGKPMDVYNDPENLFVATFIGSPSMNVIKANFKDGKVFYDKYEFALKRGFAKKIQSFYEKQKESLTLLKESENLNDHIKEIESANIYVREQATFEVPKKKWFKFSFKKKQKKEIDNTLEQDDHKTLEKYINANEKMLSGEGELYLGIRPEYFYLANHHNLEKPSKKIDVEVEMVELLGNEFIIHFQWFGNYMQAKIIDGHPISIGDNISLVYDLDKLHVFDIESGLVIK